jgi:hypothetical protein
MNMQSQQRPQKDISDLKLSKGQLGGGINKLNAENSKNWRDDAKGKNYKTFPYTNQRCQIFMQKVGP